MVRGRAMQLLEREVGDRDGGGLRSIHDSERGSGELRAV